MRVKKRVKITAWKKNREFGDIFGGRLRRRMTDNIFKREHTLLEPSPFDETPIFMLDNPSRDYFFPISVEDIKKTLKKYAPDSDFITHIWLRRTKPKHHSKVYYIWGSRVYLITLYPMRKDLRIYLGKQKPLGKELHEYQKYAELNFDNKKGWFVQFTEQSVKNYYIKELLCYAIEGLIKDS